METKRKVNPGAESFLFEPIEVLNLGYVKLVDYLGNDQTVTDSARVSYNATEDDPERNKKLINYLLKNKHTSPFEQCVLTFECKMPIFVAREWVRHRTARLNEVSGRYTQLDLGVYTPTLERIQGQDKVNRQGSAGEVSKGVKEDFMAGHIGNVNKVFHDYRRSIENGIAKEIARIDLPLSTYTKWVWQCDLHNLLHFLHLRMAAGAQWEIRQYANAIANVVEKAFPWSWAAFKEHVMDAVTITQTEYAELKEFKSMYQGLCN